MTPTRPWQLVLLAVFAAAIGFASVGLWDAAFGRTLPVPVLAPVTLFFLAVALGIWAFLIRPRILRKPGTKPISPFVAARTAALAMAASRTGAIVGGFYAGVALALSLATATPAVSERLWLSAASMFASLLMVLAALWLEHVCRLRHDDDDDPPSPTPSQRDADWVLPNTQRRKR